MCMCVSERERGGGSKDEIFDRLYPLSSWAASNGVLFSKLD